MAERGQTGRNKSQTGPDRSIQRQDRDGYRRKQMIETDKRQPDVDRDE